MNINKKVYLDPEHVTETGSICWSIDDTYCSHKFSIDASIKIYDCSRSITLDFDCYTEGELSNRLKKLEVLISELTEMRELLKSCKKTKFYY